MGHSLQNRPPVSWKYAVLFLYDVWTYKHGSWWHAWNPNLIIIPWISVAHRRGGSGCSWRAFFTLITFWFARRGSYPLCAHHSLYDVSMYTYRVALGGGASAKALVASDPMVIWFASADAAQKIRAPLFQCSSVCFSYCNGTISIWWSITLAPCLISFSASLYTYVLHLMVGGKGFQMCPEPRTGRVI